MTELHRRIGCVIVNFRSEDILERSLQVHRDEFIDHVEEIVIVDNSADGRQISVSVEGLAPPRIVHNERNCGFARAVNQGVERLDAEYILLLNPDTILETGCLRTLMEVMDADEQIAVAAPKIMDADGTVQGSARREPSLVTGLFGRNTLLTRYFPNNPISRRQIITSDGPEGSPMLVDWVSGACMLVRAAALKSVGGFDEAFFMYWEDADVCRRLRGAGYQVVYVPAVHAIHLCGASSESVPYLSIFAFHRSVFHYFRKHIAPGVPFFLLAPIAFGLVLRCVAKCFCHWTLSLLGLRPSVKHQEIKELQRRLEALRVPTAQR